MKTLFVLTLFAFALLAQTPNATPAAPVTPVKSQASVTLSDAAADHVENLHMKIELVQRRAQLEISQIQAAMPEAEAAACKSAGLDVGCVIKQDPQSGKWTAFKKEK